MSVVPWRAAAQSFGEFGRVANTASGQFYIRPGDESSGNIYCFNFESNVSFTFFVNDGEPNQACHLAASRATAFSRSS